MYYFIGIKGTGMSALAIILKRLGNQVSGSDLYKHFFTEKGLIENDIPFYSYSEDNIKEGYTIIKGGSIKEDNVELIKAKELGLEILEYHEMVGKLSREYKTICVAGCHGKTTTTNMLALALRNQGINYLIGDGTGSALRENKYFALESCEYKRHFLMLDTDFWAITNIELDHTDYYKDFDDYKSAFQEWTEKIKNSVMSTENIDIPWVKQINTNHFDFKKIFWEHNDKNASIVYELIKIIKPNIDESKLKETIENFWGLRRRLEYLRTTSKWTMLFSDYWHMASSIDLCHQALKQHFPDKKLIAIFQPHQINRILRERNEFSTTLKKFDKLFIYNIYAARENLDEQLENFKHLNIENANTIQDLWNIFAKNCSGQYLTNINDIKDIINNSWDNEIIIFFTAWDLDYLIR